MNTETKIEWTDATWNPVRGCSRVSEGCRNCYAEAVAARFSDSSVEFFDEDGSALYRHAPGCEGSCDYGCNGAGTPPAKAAPFRGFALMTNAGPHWTGRVELIAIKLIEPLRHRQWAEKFLRKHGRRPRVFVNSMSDIFHESLPDEAIDRVFAVMALCPWIDFQVLTKRSERMRAWAMNPGRLAGAIVKLRTSIEGRPPTVAPLYGPPGSIWYPLPNVQLGVSVEDQPTADKRVPDLLTTAAAVRFVSYEPALGPVDWAAIRHQLSGESFEILSSLQSTDALNLGHARNVLDWLICGGESGPNARPMHPDWARQARDQCAAAGVPFHFKQWGEWLPDFEQPAVPFDDDPEISRFKHVVWDPEESAWQPLNGMWDDHETWAIASSYDEPEQEMARVGKKIAGRLLDGVEHNGFPAVRDA